MTETFTCCAASAAGASCGRTTRETIPHPCAKAAMTAITPTAPAWRILREDNAGDDTTPLCQNCYDRYYTNLAHPAGGQRGGRYHAPVPELL